MVSGQGTLKTGSLGGAIYLDYVNKTQSKTRDISNFIIANSSSCPTPNSKIDLQNNCVIEESDEDGDSDDSLNGMSGDYNTPDFQEKMEYVLRLGYTVDQFKTVWKRLGPEAKENNVLLAELLKLTQNSSMKSVNENSLEMEHNLSLNTESAASVSEKSSLSKDTINRNPDDSDNLRMIVIDGSNVAMLHGNKEVFSCKGIKYAVDYFKKRGHKKIVVFVPQWRKEAPRKDAPIIDQEILTELEKERILIFTPARTIKGKRVACYDDRYILNLADDKNAIVVSNDNYRDLLNENNGFKKVVEERLLMYSFFEDKFMPPDDPLGRHGPSLDNFLRKTPTAPETLPPNCPYGKKCTYGNKCKFYHPERGNMPHKTVTEKLAEQYKQQEKVLEAEKNKMQLKSKGKNPLSRSRSRYADGGEVPQLTAEEQEQKQRLAKEYNEKLDRSRKEITRLTEQEKAAANKTISNVDGIAAHLSQFSLSNLDSGNQGNKAVHFERYNSSSLDKFNKSPNQQQELATCDRSDVNRTHSLPAQIQSENFVSGHLQLAKSLSGEEIEAKKKSQIFPQSSPHHTPLCRQSSVYVDSEHHNKANTAMKHNLPTPNHVRQDVLSNLFSNNQGDSIFIYETMSPSYSYPPPCESFNFPPTPFPYAVSEKMILGQVYTPNITRHFSLPNTWGHDCYSPSYQIQAPDNGQKGFYETIPSSPSCLSPVYTCPVTSSNNVSLPSYVRTQQFKMPSPPRQHYSTYATTQQQSLPLQPPPPPPPPQQQQQQQPPQLNPVMSSVMSTASWPLDNTSYSDMLVHPTMSNTPQGQKMNIYYNSGQ